MKKFKVTQGLYDTLNGLKGMEFNQDETMQVLKYNMPIYWSWGVSELTKVGNKALVLRVNGHFHKGVVAITLDWSDTYNVHIIDNDGKVLNFYEMVYFDMLVEVIDNRIERIPDYEF